jgi:Tfp pilus assembly protein PilO
VVLKKGEKIDLEVSLPDNWTASTPISLEVSGYYHPEAEFMAAITRKLLKQDQ